MSSELEAYCRADAEFTTRIPVYPAVYPQPLSPWQVLWRTLKAAARVKLRLRKSVALRFLKCDKKGCVHVEFHDDITSALIGKPCPHCGSNLLTQEDYENMEGK